MTAYSLPFTAGPYQQRWETLRRGLIGSPVNAAITLAFVVFALWVLLPLWRWAVTDAVWTGDAAACAGGGACWAFIGEKLRFILFGFYPRELQWRPILALLVMLTLVVASGWPRLWGRHLGLAWLVAIPVVTLIMLGWPLSAVVSTEQWSGLPVTVLLSVGAFAAAFPLAILLALGPRSRRVGVKLPAVVSIETLRGVPFIAVLYSATLLFPLMLPAGSAIDKFLRAEVALALFVAAYLAEVIRGGLQAIPTGQYEAAKALGLSYWKTQRLVVLPQALRIVIPSLVNLAIGIFQDTTLVIIIGMFDFLNTSRVSATDPNWLGFYNEAYAFAALVYFVVCFAASRYSIWLEGRLATGHRPSRQA